LGHLSRLIKPPHIRFSPCKTRILHAKGHSFSSKPQKWSFFAGVLMIGTILVPYSASASVFSVFTHSVQADTSIQSTSITNSQNMPLAMASIGPDTVSGAGTSTSDLTINDAALAPSIGLVGNESAIDDNTPDTANQISVYVVHKGDTLSSVAKMFGVTRATISAFNDIPSGTTTLKEGTVLTILPISGFMHTVTKGETLKSLSKKFKVDVGDISYTNDLSPDDDLTIGDTLIIPDTTEKPTTKPTTGTGPTKNTGGSIKIPAFSHADIDLENFWLRPIAGGHMTQDLHGARYTGIDLGAQVGTPIMAAAGGTVIVAQRTGYNTGYGEFVVINHVIGGNTIQTVYAHMSKVSVNVGDTVSRGQVIGLVGKTGRATGAHLHFEVNGAENPFHNNPNYGL
jgi:LysM repeat protein